jgi:degradative hydroxymethylglutaryl-CoA reductase
MDFSHLSGFHKKTFKERQDTIKALYPELNGSLNSGGLDLATADHMIENCIGVLSLPLGLGLYFIVNGQSYKVPMCVEEPSIIAAACNAAKLISTCGGFQASSSDPVMIG